MECYAPELGNYIKHYEAELKEMARKRFYANKRKKAKVKEKNYAQDMEKEIVIECLLFYQIE